MIEYTYLPRLGWLVGGGVLLAILVFASYLFWAKGRSGRWMRIGLASLRWLIVAAVVFCLFDPEWIEAIKHQQRSRVAVLLDSSRSMSIKDLPEQRLAAAQHWLKRSLSPAAPPSFDLKYYRFGEGLTPLSSVDSAKASDNATGLADALDAVLATPGDDPLTGVVVCSDGLENVRSDLEAVARTYRRKGIPVHTLTVGTTNEMQDVIIENVQVKRAVPNRAPTKVTITLHSPGFGNQKVPVQILRNNELVAVQEVALNGGSQRVELDFTPRQKGFQVYEARVPAQAGEWLTSNNRRLFGLEVIDPTIRVLYMEGTPQQPNSPIPEWKYLKSALESDPDIKVTTLYREFGATGKRLNTIDVDPETGEHIYPVEHPSKGFPQTLSGLLENDVVIHSDIRKESFSPEQLQNMARLVEEFGGGFIMIGGNSAFGKGGYHRTILDRVIPVAMHQQNDSEARPFQLHVPAGAWNHPIIALGQNREETELIWTKKFPLLYGCNLVDRAKPGAIVLGDDPANRGIVGPRLLLAVQNVGKGRSMAFTSDTTRTWGKDFETLWGERINPALPLTESNCDGRYYRQFWVNAVRWLAAGKIGRTNSAVSLELAQSGCLPNENVKVGIKVRDKALRDVSTANVNVFLVAEGKTNLAGKATFDGTEHCYVANVKPPESGTYIVSAIAAIRGNKLGDDRQLLVCEDADREMGDLRAKPEVMGNLAQISGGKVLSITEKEPALAKSVFYKAPPVTVEYRHNPLWDRSWWLAAVLGMLSVEWAVRRLKGMA
jgi:uncharacterized membrane protein